VSKERNPLLLLILWVIILGTAYSVLSILRHSHFDSGAFDLGIYDQAIWLYSRFEVPYSTIKERLILGDHLTLTMPLLSILYYVWDDVKILLIFQAFWLAFSSIAIYLIAVHRKLDQLTSLIIAFTYSIFYGIQFAVFFDFHPVIIAAGLLPWLAYFIEKKSKKLILLITILIILTQENMGIAIACLGIIYLFRKEFRKYGIGFIILGLLGSLIALKVTAHFSPIGYEYSPVINSTNLFTGFFDKPEKLTVWLYSLTSFMFLPLLSPGSIIAAALDLSQYFITGQALARMWSPFTHHRIILATIFAIGTIDALVFLKNKKIKIKYVAIALFIFAVIQQYYYHFPLNKLSKPIYFKSSKWMSDNSKMFSQLSEDVPIATHQSLVPHLSHRKEIYLVWPRKTTDPRKCIDQKECWWLDFAGKPEYLLVDVHEGSSITQLLESRENFNSAIENMEKAKKIKIWKESGDSKVYKIIN